MSSIHGKTLKKFSRNTIFQTGTWHNSYRSIFKIAFLTEIRAIFAISSFKLFLLTLGLRAFLIYLSLRASVKLTGKRKYALSLKNRFIRIKSKLNNIRLHV